MDARLEAQQAVLGSILIDSRCLPTVLGIVKPGDFEGPDQYLFSVIHELFLRCGNTQQIDPVLVLEAIRARGDAPISAETLRSYVLQLMEITPTAANAERYARIVREHSRVAQIHRQASAMLVTHDLAQLRRMLTQASESAMDRASAGTLTMSQAMTDFWEQYNAPSQYLLWPFPALQQRLFASPGKYILLGAESSAGKTAMALQLGAYWASKGLKVDFFSLETDAIEVQSRMVAGFLGVDSALILNRQLTDVQLTQAAHVTTAAAQLPFGFVDACEMTVADIVARALTDGVDIAIIDYLQLIVPHTGHNREREVAAISTALKNAGRRTGITFLILAQLNDDKTYEEPTMDRIRESRQPRHDADIGFLLYWKNESAGPADPDYQKRILKIAKNKQGALGKVNLHFDAPTQLFYPTNAKGPTRLFRLPTVEQMGY